MDNNKEVKNNTVNLVKRILSITSIILVGVVCVVFAVLYIQTFDNGFFADYSTVITAVTLALITIITILTIIFFEKEKEFIYKLCLLTIVFASLAVFGLYLLKVLGFYDKISSIEEFREYISSFGGFAVILFVLIQFLQVVVLPIPSFITVGAGVLLFGAFKGAILSCIGIIAGSIVAFFLGRVFGFKVAKWLVGEKSLNKGLQAIKGKDKVVLTFMFLFPFFPDDVLCFVAGITTVSPVFFVIMTFVVRIITVFISSYSLNNSIIPYDTWWGILLWILFFVATVILTIIIYKNGEKIERRFLKKKKR